MDGEQLNDAIARLMVVAEDGDERMTELRERANRIENELAASIGATRSAHAAILTELSRLNAVFGAIVSDSKPGKNASDNADGDGGTGDDNGEDKEPVGNPADAKPN